MRAGFAKTALDWGLSAGLSVSGLYGPLKAWRERQLSQIFASGQTLRLQFPKEDLGFNYNTVDAAICPEHPASDADTDSSAPHVSVPRADGTAVNFEGSMQRKGHRSSALSERQSNRSVGGSDRQYIPSCAPGGRLPHCMLQPLNKGQTSSFGVHM